MKIQKEEDPRRYGVYFPKTNTQVICQLEPDSLDGPDRIIIGEAKVSNRAKAKLKILYGEPLQDFLNTYLSHKSYLQIVALVEADINNGVEVAFQAFIEERFGIKPDLS